MRTDKVKPTLSGVFVPVRNLSGSTCFSEVAVEGANNLANQPTCPVSRRESFSDPLKKDIVTVVSQKGPNCQTNQQLVSHMVLKKAISRKAELIPMETNQAVARGYEKRYKRNDTTGRPNQVFVCTTCHAQRPKLSKMMKHLNVHKKDRKRGGARHKPQTRIADTVKLPSMGILLKNRMDIVQE